MNDFFFLEEANAEVVGASHKLPYTIIVKVYEADTANIVSTDIPEPLFAIDIESREGAVPTNDDDRLTDIWQVLLTAYPNRTESFINLFFKDICVIENIIY